MAMRVARMTADVTRAGTVAVVGGGASGIATALSLARDPGCRILLLDKAAEIGGTVTHSLIHTLGGLYDSGGEALNTGLPVELMERLLDADAATKQRKIGRAWVLAVDPAVYYHVVTTWLNEYNNITVYTSVSEIAVDTNAANDTVKTLTFQAGGEANKFELDAVVDASGSAALVRQVSRALVMDDEAPAMAAIVCQLRGVEHSAIKFPRNIVLMRKIHAAVSAGELPDELASTWLDTGVHENEIYAKASLPVPEGWRQDGGAAFMKTAGQNAINSLMAFLQKQSGMSDVALGRTGSLGIRDGGRVKGDYQLTASDVRSRKKFDDAACRCCWPIEYWHPREGVELEYLPEGEYYEIPLSALKVRGMNNVWCVGKCLSSDRLAQASARVVGTCWAMGDAVGQAITGK